MNENILKRKYQFLKVGKYNSYTVEEKNKKQNTSTVNRNLFKFLKMAKYLWNTVEDPLPWNSPKQTKKQAKWTEIYELFKININKTVNVCY